jgi:glycosidase
MITTVNDPLLQQAVQNVQAAFRAGATKQIAVNGQPTTVAYPYPSPTDWRDVWIYFLMTDRFNNPNVQPASTWNQQYNYRQGGTFKGIEAQLDYIAGLGAGAIWISPVLKNAKPEWAYGYPGYSTQDFLSIDGRFASDGTEATAETELAELIEAAHARSLYIILDIVINHTARVFDYVYNGQVTDSFTDGNIMYGPLGDEPPIQWLNGFGYPRPDWQDTLPPDTGLSPDDAVWPADLHQHEDFFRRRGNKLTDAAPPGGGFAKGDFGSMRQLVMEYQASAQNQPAIRSQYGATPVLNILVKAYTYLIAKFDIDGFRIDTVKYVEPDMVETFGNAIREFALSIGKRNFFTFGEIYDDEQTIAQFIGRNTANTDGFGIDAALDYPLFYQLPNVMKGLGDVAAIQAVFNNRKTIEKGLLSSHGEAGKYFVTFLDNHDQNQRFNYPGMPPQQVLAGLAVLFCLQGIPCLYYGTEQGLNGTQNADGSPSLGAMESVREALWGKSPVAFDTTQFFYQQIQALGQLRANEPALQYGRLYFREVSGNGQDFGQAYGVGSIIAFSRILYTTEMLVMANTSAINSFEGFVVMDADINRLSPNMQVAYSNIGTVDQGAVQIIPQANFYNMDTFLYTAQTAALYVKLAPMEVQILKPV